MYPLSTLAWLATYGLVTIALAGIALSLPRQIALPRVARIAAAAAIVPYALAGWTVAATAIVPGLPAAVVAFAPALAAILVIAATARKLWRDVVVASWRALAKARSTRIWATAIGAAIVLAALAQPIAYRISQPVGGSDALQYLDQAERLAETRDFRSYPGFRGLDDGSLRGDIHGPAWPAYLAHALMANAAATGEVGPPRDLAVRAALSLTFLSTFIAIGAVTFAFRGLLLAPLFAVLIFLTTSHVDYILSDASRDGFRVVPILVMIALLIGQLRHRSIARDPLTCVVLLALVAIAVVNGHTLATVEVPLIVAAWLVLANWRKLTLLPSFLVLAALGVGALAGGFHYVQAYLETGSPWGSNVIAEHALEGTPYESALGGVHDPRISGGTSALGMAWTILARDLGQLAGGILVSAYLFWRFAARDPRLPFRDAGVQLVSLATLAMAALFLVLGQSSALRLTYSAAANFRYLFVWNALSSIALAVFVDATLQRLLVSERLRAGWRRTEPKLRYALAAVRRAARPLTFAITALARAAIVLAKAAWVSIVAAWDATNRRPTLAINLCLAVVAVAAAAWILTRDTWYRDGSWARDGLLELGEMSSLLPAGCRYMTDSDLLPYYLKAPPFKLYSAPSRALFSAPNPDAVRELMRENNICFSATLWDLYLEKAGRDTPIMRFLTDERYAIASRIVTPTGGNRFRLAIFRDSLKGARVLSLEGGAGRSIRTTRRDASVAGRYITVSFLMRAREGETQVSIVSGGKEMHRHVAQADGRWRWTSYSFAAPWNAVNVSVNFAASRNLNPFRFDIANVRILRDGIPLADSSREFADWTAERPLPDGWTTTAAAGLLTTFTFE